MIPTAVNFCAARASKERIFVKWRVQLMKKNSLILALFSGILLLMQVAFAADNPKPAAQVEDPQALVMTITDDTMKVIRTGQTALKENPQAYFAQVRGVLAPHVSFGFIAKNVMASHWASATKDQRKAFTEVFTNSMVETLGKGMANYTDLKIDTLPVKTDYKKLNRATVEQKVAVGDGSHHISYSMARKKAGSWKLVNVVLNGVNLGKSFRDQFAQGMKQHNNDVNKVIANWAKKS
jgi:phospholipid transport system substrate-binding protein